MARCVFAIPPQVTAQQILGNLFAFGSTILPLQGVGAVGMVVAWMNVTKGELKQKASKFHRFLALPYPLMRVLLIFSQTGIGLPIENTVSRTISENPKALILRVCS